MTVLSWQAGPVRAAFPALALTDGGVARTYVDAPAGTQVAAPALDRMRAALVDYCANEGGLFRTSQAAEALMHQAHDAAAALLGAESAQEIVFGLNTTSLLFSFSRMLARDWRPGDEIVLSRMDHDANVAPWLIAAEERGVTVRWLEFDPGTFVYRYDSLPDLIGPRTRLVACNHASNLLGTVNDVRQIVAAGRAVGAVTVVDAVQSAPHLPIDVAALGCDLLACSSYKVFGPHAAMLYVRSTLRDRLIPLKVRPSSNDMPWRLAPGTPSFEAQAGTLGAIEHLAWLGRTFGGAAVESSLRAQIVAGLTAATAHEATLMRQFLDALDAIPGLTLFGHRDLAGRVPTFSFRLPGWAPDDVARHLAAQNVFIWSGTFYAHEIAGVLGLDEQGVNRIGLAHYNTADEVARIGDLLATMARGR